MALEPEIAGLVDEFIAAGRPSPRNQTMEERRAGYQAPFSQASLRHA